METDLDRNYRKRTVRTRGYVWLRLAVSSAQEPIKLVFLRDPAIGAHEPAYGEDNLVAKN